MSARRMSPRTPLQPQMFTTRSAIVRLLVDGAFADEPRPNGKTADEEGAPSQEVRPSANGIGISRRCP